MTLAVIAGLLAASSPAQAGVMASADIDWSSLTWSLINLDPNDPVSFSWDAGSEYGSVSVFAETADPFVQNSDFAEAFDWTTLLSRSAVTAQAQSDASRSDLLLSAVASSQPGISAAAPNYNYANADAYNTAGFTVSGHGIVLLTVDWALSVTGLAGDFANLSYASANIYADYQNAFATGSGSSNAWLQSSDAGDNATSGTFSLAIVNLPGTTTTGSFSADVYAFSQAQNLVPEPSTFALTGLGVGLMGLLVFRRRRA
ncbi:MAG: PEP-CTERM sorting domain-containing protein [Pirellulaceae bacterium]|nr:PEP-CTERM sorting domain-containing protein [Pirellulaceae bacterium]